MSILFYPFLFYSILFYSVQKFAHDLTLTDGLDPVPMSCMKASFDTTASYKNMSWITIKYTSPSNMCITINYTSVLRWFKCPAGGLWKSEGMFSYLSGQKTGLMSIRIWIACFMNLCQNCRFPTKLNFFMDFGQSSTWFLVWG